MQWVEAVSILRSCHTRLFQARETLGDMSVSALTLASSLGSVHINPSRPQLKLRSLF